MKCRDALRNLFADRETLLTSRAVYRELLKANPNEKWTEGTVYLCLTFSSINHPMSKLEPKMQSSGFLFWDGDDSYRRWIPEQDVESVVGRERIEPLLETANTEDSTVVGPVSLSIERDLEDSLVQNLAMLESGLRLYRVGELDGRQVHTGKVGVIDLLAVDKNGDFVVIELKSGKAADSVCGQILGYMAWVRKELAGDKKVRGIIVSSDFSDRLRFAAEAVGSVSLIRYSINFNLSKEL